MRPLARLKSILKRAPGVDHLNRLRYRRINRDKPFVINLELTTKCNAACRMCPHPETDFDKKSMSMASLEKLLTGLAGAVKPGTVLYPVGLGEPLLIPE